MKPDPCSVSLLNVISFSTSIVQTSWAIIQSDPTVVSELYAIIDETKGKTPVRAVHIRPAWGAQKSAIGPAQLLIHNCCLLHTLTITDDVEIHDFGKPLPIHQIRREIQVLKKLLLRACCLDEESKGRIESNYFGRALTAAAAKTMRDLYDRSSRRPFCSPSLWLVDGLMDGQIKKCKTFSEYESLLSMPVFRICPFLVSFKRRLKLFERLVTTNRIEIQGQHNMNPFSNDPGLKPGIPVRIMRGRVLEDGLATMNKLGKRMRERIVVHYLNEAGAQEAGIDVGGLFKEFWTDLCQVAFDPNYALFRVTEGAGNCMYPNPASFSAHGSDHVTLFEFLGRILGKSMYEMITISPKFAHFFLSFLRGDYNFLHMLPDLSTMDPQLYNNLMFLKTYEGDAEDLCLTFSITNDDFGGNREIALIPGGADVAVTNSNKQRYVALVAKHYVYDCLKEQSEAFTRGLWEVIDRSWLQLFNEPELQVVISGPSDGGIDVTDMKANTRYAGGYTGLERTVSRFWSIMSSFNEEQQGSLLRFVTSCERPPPLGFASMNPPFTIQRVGILRDGDKLPTASTCFNTLKLPTYSSEKVMKDRLIYAIESGAGFELT
uniref:HECT-type E3 ubiquitin transferase n=1 Tax=Grammatophora oceanica TaxID=210454 RepID=A0A7S1VV74_9STRA|mmetsp:Transcript_9187/g.13402  ORF Transcript_9187/g.13402 Transcript_9187/m.13402 type:complete len:603 (+) Transcript_9187:2-1810(+)